MERRHSPLSRSLLACPEMLAALTLLLALPLALANEPPSCAPLVPVTFDNDTIPELMGHWIYIVGASRYPPHLEEMKMLKHAVFTLSPGSHEDEINVTETMRVNETCVTKHSTIHVFRHNSSLMHVDNNVTAVARLIQSHKDLLILSHVTENFPAVSLSARTPNASKEQLEEFSNQLHCLGFTEEEIFFTSEKDACPLPWEKTEEVDREQQMV